MSYKKGKIWRWFDPRGRLFSVQRMRNSGKGRHPRYIIAAPNGKSMPPLSTQELFDLTDLLADVCDAIEDEETERNKENVK